MSLPFRIKIKIALPSFVIMLLVAVSAMADRDFGRGHPPPPRDGVSPALCGAGDIPEPGIQGDVPPGVTANYNCGLTLRGQLPIAGQVQGAGHCAYVRTGGQILVIDVSDPDHPQQVSSVAAIGGSESFRTIVTGERAVMVSGRAVYDISNCAMPVLLGQINWPPLHLPGIPVSLLPHDLRINHAGTKVYGSFGMFEADITNLYDPASWTVTDHTCDVYTQSYPIHKQLAAAGLDLCKDLAKPAPAGANYSLGSSPLQAVVLWPPLAHGPDTNGDDTRLYMADVGGGLNQLLQPSPHLRIIDLTTPKPKILSEVDGAGYNIDWFRTASGFEFLLHNPEGGTGFQGGPGGDTCVAERDRPQQLGWSFALYVANVTNDRAKDVSQLELAINKPEFCDVRAASARNPIIWYHAVDNPYNAKFAMVSHSSAGLRVFDIRNPILRPREVAYFNHSEQTATPYYDASRGLIYIGGGAFGGGSFQVLEIQPQVRQALGL